MHYHNEMKPLLVRSMIATVALATRKDFVASGFCLLWLCDARMNDRNTVYKSCMNETVAQ